MRPYYELPRNHWIAIWGQEQTYTQKVLSTSPIAYWPCNEASGTDILDQSGNGYNGTYTGVTLGYEGIGDGNTAPLWDGINDLGDIFSAGLACAINGAEGTMAIWIRVADAGVWTNGRFGQLFDFRVNSANIVAIYKRNTNNTVEFFYRANGTLELHVWTAGGSTSWIHFAWTWSKSADRCVSYVDGSPHDTTTGLGTWVGTPVSAYLGTYNSTPSNPWPGYLAHAALWDAALDGDAIAALATV